MGQEKAYSKREQDHFFGELFHRMDKQDLTLDRIETQTVKTNGRVNKLEWYKSGFIWIIGLIIASVIPIINFVKHEIDVQTKESVSAILSNYQFVAK